MDHGNGLPRLMTEQEVAVLLRVKASTVRAERIRGKLGFVRIGARIFYTSDQLDKYLEQQTIPACQGNQTDLARSEVTGSARSLDGTAPTSPGAAPGTTSAHARRAVSALARQTFRPQRSSSQSGSWRMSASTARHQTKS